MTSSSSSEYLNINVDLGQVYGWMIGHINEEEKITTMLFGQFNKSTIPPESGWIYCGKNIFTNIKVKNRFANEDGYN